MSLKSATRLSYQDGLRVIGRRLDAEPTYHFTLVQDTHGFCIQFYPSRFRTDRHEVDFSWDRLHDLLVYHSAGRGLVRRHHRYRGIWANFPNGHEDFFRALGYDMDQVDAHDIRVEECADGVDLSFTCPGSSERTVRQMGKDEIQCMLEEAQSRRRAS